MNWQTKQHNNIVSRTTSCSLPFEAVLLPSSRTHGRLNNSASIAPQTLSFLSRASKSTLRETPKSLKSFPPRVQNIVTLLQEQFNRCVNTDDGLFELYDEQTTEQMWKATLKLHARNNMVTDSSDSWNTDDTESKMLKQQAGVLVLFVLDPNNELSIIFTRRSKHLSSHASQISFPGGHYEETNDVTIVDTAIREAVEELYHNADESTEERFRQNLHVLGCTTAVRSLRGLPVTSVLGFYNRNILSTGSDDEPITQLWPGNPSEVEMVFTVPVTTLIKEQTTVDTTFIKRAATKNESNSPQYPTSQGTIWGLTAYILQPIVQQMLLPFVESKTGE